MFLEIIILIKNVKIVRPDKFSYFRKKHNNILLNCYLVFCFLNLLLMLTVMTIMMTTCWIDKFPVKIRLYSRLLSKILKRMLNLIIWVGEKIEKLKIR